MIRISRRDSEMIRHLDEAKETLANSNGHCVTPEELAEYLEISVERVLELMETQSAAYAASLDSCLAVGEDLKLVKLLGNNDSEYDRIEDKDFLDRCFAHMTDIEQQVIKERYMADKSQREVAAGLGCHRCSFRASSGRYSINSEITTKNEFLKHRKRVILIVCFKVHWIRLKHK